MRRIFSLAILLVASSVCAVVSAKLVAAPGEQITSFQSDIVVNPDGTLTVREDFVVHSEGSYFKYGFTRNLPIDDEARWDERYAGKWTADNGIRVKILELTENGAPASYQSGRGMSRSPGAITTTSSATPSTELLGLGPLATSCIGTRSATIGLYLSARRA
jgi:hypothetical protein